MVLYYFHIWLEGAVINGKVTKASCLTERPVLASTFILAVRKFAKSYPEHNIKWSTPIRYKSFKHYRKRASKFHVNERDLFQLEKDAREKHG